MTETFEEFVGIKPVEVKDMIARGHEFLATVTRAEIDFDPARLAKWNALIEEFEAELVLLRKRYNAITVWVAQGFAPPHESIGADMKRVGAALIRLSEFE